LVGSTYENTYSEGTKDVEQYSVKPLANSICVQ